MESLLQVVVGGDEEEDVVVLEVFVVAEASERQVSWHKSSNKKESNKPQHGFIVLVKDRTKDFTVVGCFGRDISNLDDIENQRSQKILLGGVERVKCYFSICPKWFFLAQIFGIFSSLM